MISISNNPQGKIRTSGRVLQSTSSKTKGDQARLFTPDRAYCHISSCGASILPEHINRTIGTCPSCGVKTCVICKGPEHSPKCFQGSGHEGSPSGYNRTGHATLPEPGSNSSYDAPLQHPRSFTHGSHMYEDTRNGLTVLRRIPGSLTEDECALLREYKKSPRYLQYTRRARKDKGKDGQEIWPDYLEEAFQTALRCIPPMGKYKTPLTVNGGIKKACGRNELIARKIRMLTGVERKRKQISSHIQVLKNMIKDPEWLAYVETPSESDYKAPKRNFHFDEDRGEVVFHDKPTNEPKFERDNLLPPCHTLGSSLPAQRPSVTKIELEMSVYPPSSEYNEELQACHTYTRIQSEIGSQPKLLEDNVHWRELYPDLRCNDDGQVHGEIIMLDANLKLMETFSPKHSRLGIHLYADISCDKAPLSWRFRTRFYDKGRVCKENAGSLGSNCIADSSTTRVEISLFSSWWVQMFQEILERRHLVNLSGDFAALQQHEESTRLGIRGLSIMQEIFVSFESDSSPNLLTLKPAVTLLWKFRQTRPRETATTLWSKLCPPSLRVLTSSPTPKVPPPPVALDANLQPFCAQAISPLPTSQLPPTESFQSALSWEQGAHNLGDMYSIQTDDMMMDAKAESPHPSASNSYPQCLSYQAVINPAENCDAINSFHLAAPYQPGLQTIYRPANHPSENSFADYGTNQQLHDFGNHPSAANNSGDCSNLVTATDYSSQSIAGDYMRQSTAASFVSQSTGTDIASQSTTDYSQDTSDPNIDEIDSCHIELDFEHIQVQDPLQHDYGDLTLAVPVTEMDSTHSKEYQQQQEPYYSQGHQKQHHHHQVCYSDTLDLQARDPETYSIMGGRLSNHDASQSYKVHQNDQGIAIKEHIHAEPDLQPDSDGNGLSFEEWQNMEDNRDIAKSLVWLKQNASQMEYLYESYDGNRDRMRTAHTEYMNAVFGHGTPIDVPQEEHTREKSQMHGYHEGGDEHVLGKVLDTEEVGGELGDREA